MVSALFTVRKSTYLAVQEALTHISASTSVPGYFSTQTPSLKDCCTPTGLNTRAIANHVVALVSLALFPR